jgi:hypothetical protein
MTGNAVTFPLLLLLYISGRPSLLKIIGRKENKKTIQQGITNHYWIFNIGNTTYTNSNTGTAWFSLA